MRPTSADKYVPSAPGPLFDSHAHLTDARFAEDLAEVLARAARAEVMEVLVPGTEPGDAERAAAIAASLPSGIPQIVWSAGLHPHEASRWSEEVAASLSAELDAGAIAVGETGLDFHYDNSPRRAQREAFAAQAESARERGLPLIVHSRDANDETAAVLRESGIAPERVILHCFSAGPGLFAEALEKGYYVSFSGLVTFRNYETPEYLREVSADRVLIETDAPYLAPVPMRGKRNEPAFLPATLARLAEARGMDPAAAAAVTRANALRVYKLPARS